MDPPWSTVPPQNEIHAEAPDLKNSILKMLKSKKRININIVEKLPIVMLLYGR
jgi:hypothetical protein